MTPATYRAVSRGLYQQQDARIKREFLEIAREQVALGRDRLQLDRAQFEYNAARAALSVLPELIAIDQLTNIDDEAKIWRVRDRLFGASPIAPIAKMADEKRSTIDAESDSPAPTAHLSLSAGERVLTGSQSPHTSLSPGERVCAGAHTADQTNLK
jgi:hypothetical protein